jgi:two-component system, response regulator PdtaR
VLATLSYGLSQAGYAVMTADNGDDAILMAREHRPELALLDIRMEGMSGFDVAAYLREYLQTPFMFLSAFSDDETIAQVKALGAVAYLIKPLDIGQIVPAVDAAFANRVAHRAAEVPKAAKVIDKPPVGTAPMAQPVAIAVGILMHRYSLARAQALERLQRMAQAQGQSLTEESERLIAAVETLALPSSF